MNAIARLVAAGALAAVLVACAGCAPTGASTASSASSAASSASSSALTTTTSSQTQQALSLEPGEYDAAFNTDSSMFHVNEANDGKGLLTVGDDGSMTIHVSLVSKKIVNLYAGTAEEAQADQANLLEPTEDTVTYSDGATEEVYGFDIPVPTLEEDFDVAIFGEKGTWYDHKVSVSDPQAR